jgi:hypothetical protein
MLAMVASSDAPLLLLDGALRVIAASNSFGSAFHVDAADAAGRSVFALGDGRWDLPKLRSLLAATASGKAAVKAYEMDLRSGGAEIRRLVVKAEKLEYGETGPVRVLVTVSDVTDARVAERVKDDLLREKAILLQEVQHRVANSLQIIASVLMQSARNVQSEETRTHLHDAHHRVMSIATVQATRRVPAGRRGATPLFYTALRKPRRLDDPGSRKADDRGGLRRLQRPCRRVDQPRPYRHRTRHQRPQACLPQCPSR